MPTIQLPPNYPKANAVIKPSNRNLSKVQQAVNAMYKTAHKAAILSMGGVTLVAALIYGAIQALGSASSIFMVMMKMQQMMSQMGQVMSQKQHDAMLAIIANMT
jgi:hypothetical protein